MQLQTYQRDATQVMIYGSHDVPTINQLHNCIDTAHPITAVLCADGHKGYSLPIGGVLVLKDYISPSAVGFDIGCGVQSVRLDMPGSELRANVQTIVDDIANNLSFGVGLTNNERVDHPMFSNAVAWAIPEVAKLKELAHAQLGTIGGGVCSPA
jgi:tRNA-splicing ligase RtcB (3'-phosphate/5'-hydroxy nucleic acid ligase)